MYKMDTKYKPLSKNCIIFAELGEAVHKASEEEIQIPFGVGVAGTVAETKQVVNIRNAYQVRWMIDRPLVLKHNF